MMIEGYEELRNRILVANDVELLKGLCAEAKRRGFHVLAEIAEKRIEAGVRSRNEYVVLKAKIESTEDLFELDRLRREAMNKGFLGLCQEATSRLFSCGGHDLLGSQVGSTAPVFD